MFNPFTTIIGSTDDVYSYVWFLRNAHESLIKGNWEKLFYTFEMFYPRGISLNFDTPLLNTFVSFPFYHCCGPIAAYNFLVLFTFVFTFLGMFLFLRFLTKNTYAAIIGALGFTFSSYRLSRLMVGHMDLLSTEWIGFLFYFTYAFFYEKQKKRYLIGMAVSIALSAYSDYRTALMSVIVWFIVLLYTGYRYLQKNNIRIWIRSVIHIIYITCVLLIPMILIHKESFFLANRLLPSEYQYIEEGSADISWFFIPIGRSSFFLGWVSLALVGSLFFFRKKVHKYVHVRLWSIIFFFFSLVMMGTRIAIFGHTLYRGVLMPYSLFMYTPILTFLHRPSRFGLIVHLAWAVLVSYAITILLPKIQKRWIKIGFTIILGLIVIGQYVWYFQFPITLYKPSKAAEIIHKAKSGSVLAIPFGYFDAFYKAKSMNYQEELLQQPFFNKPIVGGYVTYISDKTINWYHNNKVLQKIRICQEKKICLDFTGKEKKELINLFHVSVIWIVYKDEYSHMTTYFKKQFPSATQTETNNSVIFKL